MRKLLFLCVALLVAISTVNLAVAQEEPADDSGVSFAYQGKVRVAGEPFTGQGQFKFSILDPSGQETLWSHDGTDPEVSSEPAGSVTLPVEDGTFSLIVGDAELGMEPMNATLFQSDKPLKLRVWFNDGQNGFQQMNPDYEIVNLALRALQTTTRDFTIYVNDQTGNDRNNGLSRRWPKRTIQAAIDTLPERIRCNVTIDVAEGEYFENVKIFGISIEPGKSLTILGDTAWTPASSTPPRVRVTGAKDDQNSTTRLRDHAFHAVNCSEIIFRGLLVDYCKAEAIRVDKGQYRFENCSLQNSYRGLLSVSSIVFINDCLASGNSEDGVNIASHSAGQIHGLISENNQNHGICANTGSKIFLSGPYRITANKVHGIYIQHQSAIVFGAPVNGQYGQISGNLSNGLHLAYLSYCENHTVVNWGSGNGGVGGNITTRYGSQTTY